MGGTGEADSVVAKRPNNVSFRYEKKETRAAKLRGSKYKKDKRRAAGKAKILNDERKKRAAQNTG